MDLTSDWLELLGLFRSHQVEFIVVGAYALALHGCPRNTGDIDLLVNPTPENAHRVMEALTEFGFGGLGLTWEDFTRLDQVVQLGRVPARVDLLTSITGVTWSEAFAGRSTGQLGGIPVHFLGRDQYLANKRATGRLQDLADLAALGEE
ncbi:MAG: hypothetical protein Q8O14_03665 [bacterium]|jgi:hypothetical protein|nr:hypothetical protein [bacterium]